MTKKVCPKLELENDQKFFTTTNLKNCTWPKNTTITNIKFAPQKYAGAAGLDRSPIPGSQARTG